MIEVWFDGVCEPTNPGGFAGFGAAIFINGQLAHEITGFIDRAPTTSNNLAEYQAFTAALDWLEQNGHAQRVIVFRGDSRLVICQMFGWPAGRPKWRILGGRYAPLALAARARLVHFPNACGQWVPREKNERADRLSKAELLRRGVQFRIQPDPAAMPIRKEYVDG